MSQKDSMQVLLSQYPFGLAFCLAFTLLGTTACQKPVINFTEDNHLSQAERKSLADFHADFAKWTPYFSATWNHTDATRHVCLACDVGSLDLPYVAFVFDSNGNILEANVLNAPSGGAPKILDSVKPLRVGFISSVSPNPRQLEFVDQAYSPEEGRRKVMRKFSDMRQMAEVFESWRQSDGTNHAKLQAMLEAVKTAPPK